MRRKADPQIPAQGRFEIVIKSPTLGLMTRVPADQPDPRYAAMASNVRFDDGVIRNAPGCSPLITNPVLDTPANLIFQCSVAPSDGADKVGGILIVTAQKMFAMRNLVESQFPLLQEQVLEFHGEISTYDGIRQLRTFDRNAPCVIAVSINDNLELWKFRLRLNTEADDGLSYLVPNDYGEQTNNHIFVRIA